MGAPTKAHCLEFGSDGLRQKRIRQAACKGLCKSLSWRLGMDMGLDNGLSKSAADTTRQTIGAAMRAGRIMGGGAR